YLTRFELVAFNQRLRADIRSSDWPARAVSQCARLVPRQWRGSRRERELRDYLVGVVQRAIESPADRYEQWAETLQRLHNQAVEGRLRGMALAEVRMLVESQPNAAPPNNASSHALGAPATQAPMQESGAMR